MLIYLSTLDSRRLCHYFEIMRQKVCALLSYALIGSDAFEMVVTHRDKLESVIFDSGAWTDQCSPFPTDIDEYSGYLLVAGGYYDFYITPTRTSAKTPSPASTSLTFWRWKRRDCGQCQ
jgi:hypothetical protein